MVERIIRVAWTLVSAAGAVFAVLNWRDATLDYRAVKALPDYRPDGPRGVVARANIRREQLRAAAQGCFLAAGVVTLAAPIPVPPSVRRLTITGLMVAQVALVINDVLDRNDRRRTIEAPYRQRRRTDRV